MKTAGTRQGIWDKNPLVQNLEKGEVIKYFLGSHFNSSLLWRKLKSGEDRLMIDEENLVEIANELLTEIQKDGLPEKALLRNKPIQDLTKGANIYRLILTVKWFDGSATVPTENSLLQDSLIKAAKDLNKLTPGIEDFDFIERDVQHFTDMLTKKYTLSVVIRLYDYRTTEMT